MSASPGLLEILTSSTEWLAKRGITNARREAEELLAHGLGCTRLDLYMEFDRPLNDDELGTLRALLARRGRREPLQYILGSQPFRNAELRVDARVLIPRPETEGLVDLVLKHIPDPNASICITDVGTGSGCLAISLAQEIPGAQVQAFDLSSEALELARENAGSNGVGARVSFAKLDLHKQLPPSPVDVLVSNPPYVRLKDEASLEPELKHEPRMALFDGDTAGISCYKRFAATLDSWLRPGGMAVFEIGADQGAEVQALFEPVCRSVEVIHDLAGRDRYVIAWRHE